MHHRVLLALAVVPVLFGAAPPGKFRVSEIVVVGNTYTPQALILAQVPFGPGSSATAADLAAAERNLASLGRFRGKPQVRVLGVEPAGPIVRIDVGEKEHNDPPVRPATEAAKEAE